MNEFQPSTGSTDYRDPDGARLASLGNRVRRPHSLTPARRRELLHDLAIIAVGVLISVVAICIIFGRTFPALPVAAAMPDWPPGWL